MNELSLFTGIGGGVYGSLILGWKVLAYVEKDEYCQKVIKQRQEDGWFEKGPIYGDIKEFNKKHAKKFKGKIDVITGGFPCQPFSTAGVQKGASDKRYIFDQVIKTVQIIQPKWLFFENVPGILTSDTIVKILTSLEMCGFKLKPPLCIGSADCGQIHRRKRIWFYASNTTDNRTCGVLPKTLQRINKGSEVALEKNIRCIEDLRGRSDIPEPLVRRVDDESADWRSRHKGTGNAQDPVVMATAWSILHTYC